MIPKGIIRDRWELIVFLITTAIMTNAISNTTYTMLSRITIYATEPLACVMSVVISAALILYIFSKIDPRVHNYNWN